MRVRDLSAEVRRLQTQLSAEESVRADAEQLIEEKNAELGNNAGDLMCEMVFLVRAFRVVLCIVVVMEALAHAAVWLCSGLQDALRGAAFQGRRNQEVASHAFSDVIRLYLFTCTAVKQSALTCILLRLVALLQPRDTVSSVAALHTVESLNSQYSEVPICSCAPPNALIGWSRPCLTMTQLQSDK